MKSNPISPSVLLTIYLNESRHWKHQPIYEVIVTRACAAGLAGATVLRGPMGFGTERQVQTAKILQLSDNLPVVVEIVDSEPAIRDFLESIREIMDGELATITPVESIRFAQSDR